MILKDMVNSSTDEQFLNFSLDDIQAILTSLQNTEVPDLAHAELMQQRALIGANMVCDFLAKVVKIVSSLDNKINSMRSTYAINYRIDGKVPAADVRTLALKSCPDVSDLEELLSNAKASKSFLERKYDILIKTHHHYKDIAAGLRTGSRLPSSFTTDNFDEFIEK
jgi:hypothetical protein